MESDAYKQGSGLSRLNLFNRSLRRSLRKSSRIHLAHKPIFQYIRGDLLGKGSYGSVHLGLNATTGEVMAIKQVELKSSAVDRSTSQRQRDVIDALKSECDTLKNLDHPHIVQYLGYEENPHFLSIFLEYVPGGTIKSCLNNYGRFREDVTKSFTSQILSGLDYLHSNGVIHRDLKADNILLEPSGICKISDFGISKKVQNIQNIRAFTGMKGTIYWMAPEILDPKKAGYDVKVDIWSVGCVVLEMWSGKRPWNGQNIYTVMLKLSQHKESPPIPANLHLGPMAEQFRLECFQPNPETRPTAMQLRAHPYLKLPPNWTFPYVIHERRTSRQSVSKSISTSRRGSFLVGEDAPPVPSLKEIKTMTAANEQSIPTSRPLIDTDALPIGPRADNLVPLRPSVMIDGPPIVIITPPGSPKHQPYDDFDFSKSSDTSGDTRSMKLQRRKMLVVTNPDCDSDSEQDCERREQYVYTPPPLPETLSPLPYQLASSEPSVSLHHPCASGHNRSHNNAFRSLLPFDETSPPSTSSSVSTSSTSPPQSSPPSDRSDYHLTCLHVNARNVPDRVNFSDNDTDTDTDDDLQLWNRPPADLRKLATTTSLHLPSTSHTQGSFSISSPSLGQPSLAAALIADADSAKQLEGDSRRSRKIKNRESTMSTTSWMTRPDVKDVYDRLQHFFPHHDIDRAIVQVEESQYSATFDLTADSGHRTGSRNTASVLGPSAQTKCVITKLIPKKSIRQQVVKRQSNAVHMQRMTKLWDSHVQEL
ncbi:hypothetical protein AX17_000851 [Amanita inopinata Kibby_2008]|nr:hypothetical protein AX17_000851 [Amanita inopinata Kibby_2008]